MAEKIIEFERSPLETVNFSLALRQRTGGTTGPVARFPVENYKVEIFEIVGNNTVEVPFVQSWLATDTETQARGYDPSLYGMLKARLPAGPNTPVSIKAKADFVVQVVNKSEPNERYSIAFWRILRVFPTEVQRIEP